MEDSIPSEINQSRKVKGLNNSCSMRFLEKSLRETECGMVIARDWKWEEWKVIIKQLKKNDEVLDVDGCIFFLVRLI